MLFGSSALAALAVIFGAPAWLTGTSRAVAAYDAAAAVLIVLFWTVAMHGEAERTEERAAAEDPGRNIAFVVVLLSVAVGLASAIVILGRGPHVQSSNEKLISYALAIGAVVTGWFLIHTMFTLRYAHLFYYDENDDHQADGGLTFPGTPKPNDFDFAYFAFVVGMTFQVSDVEVTRPAMRRIVLLHGLISFGYSTAILALGVNIVSGLLH